MKISSPARTRRVISMRAVPEREHGTKQALGLIPLREALAEAPTPRKRAESIMTEEQTRKQ